MRTPWSRLRRNSGNGKREQKQQGSPPKQHPIVRLVVCIVLFLVLCVPAIFINSAIGYLPPLIFLFAVALSYVYIRILTSGLQYGGLSSKGTCPRNTDVKFLVRFKNRYPLIYTCVDATFRVSDPFGQDDVLRDFSFSLNPRENRDFEFGVNFAHIGEIEVGVTQIVLHDPLGIFTRSLPAGEMTVVEVTPRIFPVDDNLIRALELDESSESVSTLNRDGMDYMGVREYQLGDLMKTIHWKLFPRTGTMYTKLFETTGNPGVDILCDLYNPSSDIQSLLFTYDAIMELSLSVHHFGLAHSLRVDLLFYDEAGELSRFTDTTEIDHRELIRDMPLPSSERDEDEVANLVAELTLNASSHGNMIVCVSYISTSLVASLLEAQSRGRRIIVFLIVPEQAGDDERKEAESSMRRLNSEGVECVIFADAEELEEVALG